MQRRCASRDRFRLVGCRQLRSCPVPATCCGPFGQMRPALRARRYDADVQYEVEINGRVRQVTVRRVDGRFDVAIDRRQWMIDAARIDAHTWSLLIDEAVRTSSHEVTLAAGVEGGALNVRVDGAPVAVCINGRRRPGRKDEGAPAG